MNYAPEVSGTAPYTHRMADALARDHEVEVLAGLPHYPEWRLHQGYAGWKRQSVEDGVRIRRLWHVIPRHPNPVSRLLHELTFAARVVTQRVERPDVVIAVSPPLFGAAAALLVARRLQVPLGLIVQDIYSAGVPGTCARPGPRPTARRRGSGASSSMSWSGLRESPRSTTASLLGSWRSRGARTRISQSSVTGRIFLTAPGRPSSSVSCSDGVIGTSSFTPGTWVRSRVSRTSSKPLATLIDADLPLTYVLLGDGNQRPGLQRLARGVRSIQFLPSADAKEYSSILRAADVLLVNERVGVVEMSLPSKLTSYCAAARPILAAVSSDGATSEALARSGAGILAPPGNPSALNDAALTLINDADRAAELGENGRNFAKEHFGEQTAIQRYETWIRKLAGQTRAIAR